MAHPALEAKGLLLCLATETLDKQASRLSIMLIELPKSTLGNFLQEFY